ncbi:Succinyl-diaminopimelate desuccinylase [Rickettsiales bacterium Ac37b]|nr:Succinyl-diaminopimelate desuccinylase [Rickettsiales bacterium Ac37b]
MIIDPIKLSCDLINCPSITPIDAGAIDLLIEILTNLGFKCNKLPFEGVVNLYARLGTNQPNFCFAGHTDVVPPGDESLWTYNPFQAHIQNNYLYGRGAVDMKPAIACFISAVSILLQEVKTNFSGSISLMITGDEEGIAINGTRKILQWLQEQNETIDACLVGEPTNPNYIGEMIKIGRRGSISFSLTVNGIQGHVAYPHLADNPIHTLVKILNKLHLTTLDKGNEFFDPSHLEITSIDVDNNAKNVIPAKAVSQFNIRFNNLHTGNSLIFWVKSICEEFTDNFQLDAYESASPFIFTENPLKNILINAIQTTTNHHPILSTTGGTSDARFIKDICPVIEFGLINKTAHKIDEHVSIEDINTLTQIYYLTLKNYFNII